jgi:hypothetical protein
MKTIVAIWNTEEKGKSTTILELANLITTSYPSYKLIFCSKNVDHLTIDFRLIIEINGKVIAFESQGDPNTAIGIRLNQLENTFKPQLLFCTCRTRGETVTAISNFAHTYSYDTIWSSTYDIKHTHKLVNKLKAAHILDLTVKLGLL